MAPELYLIAPPDAQTAGFANTLRRALGAVRAAALVLPRGARREADYAAFVREITFIGQEAGAAVLIEGEPRLALDLAVDGLHVEGGPADLKAALGALNPDLIVGAGGIRSRHEAMVKGELGPDYIMFGPLSGASAPESREMAAWWAQTMEIPSVLSDPAATAATADAAGCEFFAPPAGIWAEADPAAVLAAFARRLGVK